MSKYCLACDLVDDPKLIAEYDRWHLDNSKWPTIQKSITDAGIINMEIYRFGNRLFMIMETNDAFTFERKATMDAGNAKVQEWEQLMWTFQQTIPGSKPGRNGCL